MLQPCVELSWSPQALHRSLCSFEAALLLFLAPLLPLLFPVLSSPPLSFILLAPVLSCICGESSDLTSEQSLTPLDVLADASQCGQVSGAGGGQPEGLLCVRTLHVGRCLPPS